MFGSFLPFDRLHKTLYTLESAPDRLYGEIGRLKMELDWLKKKSGISPP